MRLYIPLTLLAAFGLVSSIVGCASNYNNSDGVRFYGQAKYGDAIQSFRTASNVDPDDADIWYNLGATYHKLGTIARLSNQPETMMQQFKLAEDNYRIAIAKNPEHTAAYRSLAVMWCESGHPKEAFELLSQWANRSPANAEAKVELARLYQEFNKIEDAAVLLQSALTVEPTNARALRASGFLNEASGRSDLAMEMYRRSLAADANQQDLSEHLTAIQNRIQTTVTAPVITPYNNSYGTTQLASPVVAPYNR
ncbi:MAG: tetratricopeptide repeat protein [Planctomycetaceae bacterium]|nr:tetratricopeptide repeat protein [Planctomycetaceae bacterium]